MLRIIGSDHPPFILAPLSFPHRAAEFRPLVSRLLLCVSRGGELRHGLPLGLPRLGELAPRGAAAVEGGARAVDSRKGHFGMGEAESGGWRLV